MTFGWYQLKLLGALLGIFEFKFLFWRQSSNVIYTRIYTSYKFEHFIERKMSSQKKRTLLSAREKVWVVNCYNEMQFNLYYNLLTMFSMFWSITSLLAFDIRTVSAKTVGKYFVTFFSATVTEFLKTSQKIHIYNDFTFFF
jgi:hypothetical protein